VIDELHDLPEIP
jgi:hypothetical protein